ncbi:MAG: exodeoxyribonuclease VII large subunit [Betaproteobacteria bacterium]|nr:exodeoxyribonuclease VII large subunit [Betaproteobacteria bacterium]
MTVDAPRKPAGGGVDLDPAATGEPVAGSAVVPVSLLVSSARLLLERHLGLLWVSGEISGFTRAASGHSYFTLKDASAQVRCVFFRHKAQGLSFTLRDGLAVEVRAIPTIYDARGDFQLSVETARMAGLGALYERFLRMKTALEAAGWFDPARKRELPRFPRRVGVVTSRQAAALRDVLTTLQRRYPAMGVVIYPSSVQGAGAADELAAAIRTANQRNEVDVLIVCRGGGSLEDLWAFNEETLARAVLESRLPVVSGVGHETDFTICDFVADVRAATPTAAAALVVPDREALRNVVGPLGQRVARAWRHGLDTRSQRLDLAAQRLVHPAARLAQQAERTQRLGERLTRAWTLQRDRLLQRVAVAQLRLLRELHAPVPQVQRVAAASRDLARAGRNRLARMSLDVERLADALAHLSPVAVLDRGYAIVQQRGNVVVTDSRQLAVGENLSLTFAQGRAQAEVVSTEPPAVAQGPP